MNKSSTLLGKHADVQDKASWLYSVKNVSPWAVSTSKSSTHNFLNSCTKPIASWFRVFPYPFVSWINMGSYSYLLVPGLPQSCVVSIQVSAMEINCSSEGFSKSHHLPQSTLKGIMHCQTESLARSGQNNILSRLAHISQGMCVLAQIHFPLNPVFKKIHLSWCWSIWSVLRLNPAYYLEVTKGEISLDVIVNYWIVRKLLGKQPVIW